MRTKPLMNGSSWSSTRKTSTPLGSVKRVGSAGLKAPSGGMGIDFQGCDPGRFCMGCAVWAGVTAGASKPASIRAVKRCVREIVIAHLRSWPGLLVLWADSKTAEWSAKAPQALSVHRASVAMVVTGSGWAAEAAWSPVHWLPVEAAALPAAMAAEEERIRCARWCGSIRRRSAAQHDGYQPCSPNQSSEA